MSFDAKRREIYDTASGLLALAAERCGNNAERALALVCAVAGLYRVLPAGGRQLLRTLIDDSLSIVDEQHPRPEAAPPTRVGPFRLDVNNPKL